MKICDVCKHLHRPVSVVNLVSIKSPESSKSRPSAAKDREMVSIPIDLCEECIDVFHKALGRFVNQIRKGNDLPKQFKEEV